MTEIGYKLKHIPSGKYKNRAGGTLWSDEGDIYYSLPRIKQVMKLFLKQEQIRKQLRMHKQMDLPSSEYQIEEFKIKPTGNVFKFEGEI